MTYTNSIEALNKNYADGERFFELDFDITSDGYVVCIHGWESMDSYINGVIGHQYTLSEFKNMKRKDSLTQMGLDDLINWLRNHSDAHIITDVKSDNILVLSIIASKYPKYKNHFIPQIYRLREYSKVRDLGFENIILTLYVKEYRDDIVIEFAKKYPLFAVTMWESRAKGELAKKLHDLGIVVYAHTVNDKTVVEELKLNGVYGVYTDFLKVKDMLN